MCMDSTLTLSPFVFIVLDAIICTVFLMHFVQVSLDFMPHLVVKSIALLRWNSSKVAKSLDSVEVT